MNKDWIGIFAGLERDKINQLNSLKKVVLYDRDKDKLINGKNIEKFSKILSAGSPLPI